MINKFSIRKTANICGINKNTAFAWRHKILDALQNIIKEIKLERIVEADETFLIYRTREIIAEVKLLLCYIREL